jgi:hypothetical protein
MAAQLYNFRGTYQLVDVPDRPALSATPVQPHPRGRDLARRTRAPAGLPVVGMPDDVRAALQGLRAYPWAPVAVVQPGRTWRQRLAIAVGVAVGIVAALTGLGYALYLALLDVWAGVKPSLPVAAGALAALGVICVVAALVKGRCNGGLHCHD